MLGKTDKKLTPEEIKRRKKFLEKLKAGDRGSVHSAVLAEANNRTSMDLLTTQPIPPSQKQFQKIKDNQRTSSFDNIMRKKIEATLPRNMVQNESPNRKRSQTLLGSSYKTPSSPILTEDRIKKEKINVPPQKAELSLEEREELSRKKELELQELEEKLNKRQASLNILDQNISNKCSEINAKAAQNQMIANELNDKIKKYERIKKEAEIEQAKLLAGTINDHQQLASYDLQQLESYLESWFNPNVPYKYGKTVLHKAAKKSKAEHVALLLTNEYTRAEPNLCDDSGSLPLHYAVQNKNLDITKLLLWSNNRCISNANTKDKNNKKPIDYLNKDDNVELFALLENAALEADNIYISTKQSIQSELEGSNNRKSRFLEFFSKNKDPDSQEKKTSGLPEVNSTEKFLLEQLDGMIKTINKTILLVEQKKELIDEVEKYRHNLHQDFSVIRQEIKIKLSEENESEIETQSFSSSKKSFLSGFKNTFLGVKKASLTPSPKQLRSGTELNSNSPKY